MDNQKIREILDKYLERVRGFFNLKMAVLYGSYATGNPHEYSDIDVAIFVKKDEIDDLLEKEIFLFNLSSEVDIHIEPNLFYVEDLNDPEPASFVNHILKNGIILYNKNNVGTPLK